MNGANHYAPEESYNANNRRTFSGDLSHSNSITRATTTEGWLELFLTPSEKFHFSQWEEIIRDRSLVHNKTQGIFKRLSREVLPDNVAPNLVTLCGFLLLGNAWYITNNYGEAYPVACK